MTISKTQWTGIARTILVALLAICAILGYDLGVVQPREQAIAARAEPLAGAVSHFRDLEADTLKAAAPTAVGTATPAAIIDSLGVSNLFEVRDAATPVFTIADGGLATLAENSIDADEAAFMTDVIYFCGQQVVTGTVYFGPVTAFLTGDYSAAYVMGDAQCNALDNTTEATADAPIGYANTSFKVLGMMCEASNSGSNGVTFTMRSAAADLTPSMTCTVATGDTSCTSVASSTTDVAAGATVAIKVVNTEDLSAQDGWCKVLIAYK